MRRVTRTGPLTEREAAERLRFEEQDNEGARKTDKQINKEHVMGSSRVGETRRQDCLTGAKQNRALHEEKLASSRANNEAYKGQEKEFTAVGGIARGGGGQQKY